MAAVCSKCGADNNDVARFCDQCAAPLTADAAAVVSTQSVQATPAAGGAAAINWVAILVVAVVVGALGWLIFAPHGAQKAPMAGAGEMAASGENPHAAGGEATGGGMNGDIMKQLSDAKAAAEKDPLDTDALSTLYSMYGTIGRQAQVRPYLDKAYEAFLKKRGELGDEATGTLIKLVSAALMGSDAEGAVSVLEKYHKEVPDDLSIVGMLGDVCFDTGLTEQSIKWYTQYLAAAKPEEAGETFWRVKTDRATMYLNLGQPVEGKDNVQLAVSELETVTQQAPGLWNGWFNLGVAYNTAKQKDKAKAAWQKALTLGNGEIQKWQVESELAKLDGKEPPPPPQNPHGDMDMGAGAASPHGGMGGGGGAENPHGDGSDPHAGMENPHGGGESGK